MVRKKRGQVGYEDYNDPTLLPTRSLLTQIDKVYDIREKEDLKICGVRSEERKKQTEENLQTGKTDDKTVNEKNIENPMSMHFEDDVHVNDVSINLLGLESQ